ncbi:recombinase family protein [Alicyclobacillus tolerans]|uniref:recombinase family protein n=1 Tax=Alicyclobacillus tolerans TaxID=90970 RepID=UPI001F1FA9EF|nr:recombinase family protein [Alicyclobacillus tolerans]MCF8564466.1 recombinase family protein [Alicyclobacillus tolerans]
MDERTVAVYVRVSTDEQAEEGHSLVEQEEQLLRFAHALGYTRIQVYRDDGYSAKSLERPALQRLLEDVRAKRIEGVLTTRIDRLSRKNRDFSYLIDVFNACQCFYRSVKQNFEINTTTGKLTAQILSIFAEFERDLIADRVYENLKSMAKKGETVTRPCYGYQVVQGQLVPHPIESVWVKKAAQMLLQGHGSRAVALYLNQHNVLSKNKKTWNANSVRTLFQNEVLTGKMVWNRRKGTGRHRTLRDEREWVVVDGHHEPLLSQGDFQAINDLFARRRAMSKRGRQGARLLSDVAYCGFCGGKMHAGWQIYYRDRARTEKVAKKTYRCGTYATKGTCRINRVDADDLDAFVVDRVMRLSRRLAPEPLRQFYGEDSLQSQVKACKRALKAGQERMDRLLDSLSRGIIDDADFVRQKQRIAAVQSENQHKLQELHTLFDSPSSDALQQAFLQKLERLNRNLDGDERAQRAAVERLVRKVVVYRENRATEPSVEIEFFWQSPII